MKECIFHVGMPKTATTSIQRTLAFRLTDPGFRLVSGDDIYGNLIVGALFLKHAETDPVLRNWVESSPKIAEFRRKSRLHLKNELKRAGQRDICPIVSAELAFRLSANELTTARDFFAEYGFRCRIMICLRPPLDQLESTFQQITKMNRSRNMTLDRWRSGECPYRQRLTDFDEVFGRDNVDAWVFNPQLFPHGCAVLEFCRRAGIAVEPAAVARVNEALNANVIKCLYAWSRFGPESTAGRWPSIKQSLLIRQLQPLEGPRFEFHSDMSQKLYQRFQDQQAWLEERLGGPFPATLRSRNTETGVRCEDDLMDFGPEILEWLGQKTGQSVLPEGRGESTARRVAQQMRALPLFTDRQVVATEVSERLHFYWHRFLHSIR